MTDEIAGGEKKRHSSLSCTHGVPFVSVCSACEISQLQVRIAQLEKLTPARGAVFEAIKAMFRSLQAFEIELLKDHRVSDRSDEKISISVTTEMRGEFTVATAAVSGVEGFKVTDSSYRGDRAISYALTELGRLIDQKGMPK